MFGWGFCYMHAGCASSIRSECGRANNDINATREMWKFFARVGGISK